MLGFWGGVRYGRARATLRDQARHARSAAAFAVAMKSNVAVNQSILDVLKARQARDLTRHATPSVVIDWQVILSVVNDAGYMIVPKNAALTSELRH